MPPLQPDVDALDNEASPIVEAASELPVLTATPTAYSGCCLALSKPLIAYFASLLPQPPSLALSIGSGFGLLESYLIVKPHAHHIIGVEGRTIVKADPLAQLHRPRPSVGGSSGRFTRLARELTKAS